MAVATPILERKTEEREEKYERFDYASRMTEDEIHNSRISNIYARLIDPESKMSDFKPAETQEPTAVQDMAPAGEIAAREEASEQVYLVQNARADADIFRADSAVNMRTETVNVQSEPVMQAATSDEENEDLLPSRTTMQYSTEAKKELDEGIISNRSASKHVSLSKRDKVIIAVVVSVIVALFVLIIVNSAIISGVNRDMGSLHTSLNAARNTYERVANEVSEYEENFDAMLQTLADSYGMVR